MTVRNIAVSVARLLQADDIESILTQTDEDGELSSAAADDEDVKLLVACINSATCDIAADGFPICVTETHEARGGAIALSEFTRTPSTVRKICDKTGTVTFEQAKTEIIVPRDGVYDITFTVEPENAELDANLEMGAMCDRSMLAYMSARNYCLVTGRTDEATVWDQMYEAHTARKRLTRRARLPRRVWR